MEFNIVQVESFNLNDNKGRQDFYGKIFINLKIFYPIFNLLIMEKTFLLSKIPKTCKLLFLESSISLV